MHSHSFQDAELKLYWYVNDSLGHVIDGLTIYMHNVELSLKGL